VAMQPDPRPTLVPVAELGKHLRAKRRAGRQSLRDVAAEMGHRLTPSTLSRIEHGAVPDSANVPTLAEWLGLPLSRIGWPGESDQPTDDLETPQWVEVHLRADRRLAPDTADALARMFEVLYDAAVAGSVEIPTTRRGARRSRE
jgi:transcriptional regulator with XRE-family HTH domain